MVYVPLGEAIIRVYCGAHTKSKMRSNKGTRAGTIITRNFEWKLAGGQVKFLNSPAAAYALAIHTVETIARRNKGPFFSGATGVAV